jgi:Domain of unknown function (DUF362)
MRLAFPLPELPKLRRLRARRPAPPAVDVEAVVRAGLGGVVGPGARVAIAVGSRGIAELPRVVRATVEAVRAAGASPFLVPAMGSHGGATAEGQRAVLEHLGITETSVGAPVRASMEVVTLGSLTTPRGRTLEVVVDAIAAREADLVIPVCRVKPHTGFRGEVESGIAKMLVIGLGKHQGAARIHEEPYTDFGTLLPRARDRVTAGLRVPAAVAIVENAFEELAHLEVVAGHDFAVREPELLARARAMLPRIGLSPIDVCVVERIGKNVSGTGLDPNVLGRAPGSTDPRIERIVVLGLTRETEGNGNGIGMADVTTARVRRTIDEAATATNVLASRNLASGKMPIVLPTDEAAIGTAMHAVQGNAGPLRIVRIASTLELGTIAVSPALVAEALASGAWEDDGDLEGWLGPAPDEGP